MMKKTKEVKPLKNLDKGIFFKHKPKKDVKGGITVGTERIITEGMKK